MHFSAEMGRSMLVIWAQASPFNEKIMQCKYFPHVTHIPTHTINLTNNVLIKHAILLNIIYNAFIVRDTNEQDYIAVCILTF